MTVRSHPGFGEVAGLRSVGACHLLICDLDGGVAVGLGPLDLGDANRTGLDHGHRDCPVLVIEDLRHAQLLTNDHVHVLISTSTPAGRSSRISASTVFGVGSRMSMR